MITIQGASRRELLERLGMDLDWVIKVEKRGDEFKLRVMLQEPLFEAVMVVQSLHELADEIKRIAFDVDLRNEIATVPSEK